MLNISPGYTLVEKITEGHHATTYTGFEEVAEEKQPRLFKVLQLADAGAADAARLKLECKTRREIESEGIVKTYDFVEFPDVIVLILEAFDGVSLAELQEEPFAVEAFLHIAIQLAAALGDLHQHNLIHKSINPQNILIHQKTNRAKFADFGSAVLLSREEASLYATEMLSQVLPYISPEQSGRMNRTLDYRTDFYSLGVVFYEMLTGVLPFPTSDPMELVHSHIARQPVDPSNWDNRIPTAVSGIVMKLLAKEPEARYQSGHGLTYDLERCLQQWQQSGTISPFPYGQQDLSDKFLIPEKLYGRQAETNTLLTAFERTSQGAAEMMIVSGYTGIGKSALVNEIHKPIVRSKGYFISGKFDQFNRDIAYSAITSAFQGLVRQLLSESEARIQTWKEQLLQALAPNGQVIIDVIPEIELIIGAQPAVPELGPQETQNRFNFVFQKFLRVFARPEHPLVLFLDDLQWADVASLSLIQNVITAPDTRYLLLLGAFRDNEVSASSPLAITLDEIRQTGVTINEISLSPLDMPSVNQLVADTLKSDRNVSQGLSQLIYQKTAGNPFFIKTFLTSIYQEGMISFNPAIGWQWEMDKINEAQATINVGELMTRRINQLPDNTRETLKLAACLGSNFELGELAIIGGEPEEKTFSLLHPALKIGLILQNDSIFRFVHDRVQAAAYALIPDKQKKVTHLQIGRSLLARVSQEKQSDKIFHIVDHFNAAQELLTGKDKRMELTRLNLEAGQKANRATAYHSALQYFTTGIDNLPPDMWEAHYELTLTLHRAQAEAAYLNGEFELAEQTIDAALAHAKTAIERGSLYDILIVQYTLVAKYDAALEIGRKALHELDVEVPEENLEEIFQSELAQYHQQLGDRDIASLIDEPELTSPEKRAAVNLLVKLLAPAYLGNVALWSVLVLKLVNLSLQHGHSQEAAVGYANLGAILVHHLEKYQTGYEFGILALRLSEKYDNPGIKCRAATGLANSLMYWVEPIANTYPLQKEAALAGLHAGEFEVAGYVYLLNLLHQHSQGKNPENLLGQSSDNLRFCRQTKNEAVINTILGLQLVLYNLRGLTEADVFQSTEINEADFLEHCKQHNIYYALCTYQILKAQILYLYGKSTEALSLLQEAEDLLPFIATSIILIDYNAFYSLILLALYPEASRSQQKAYWQQVEANQKQLKTWTGNCPQNFEHKYLLVAAEMARIQQQDLEAMELYDRAIQSAQENDFIHYEALANELAAQFWMARGKGEFARIYMTSAYSGYQLWGARHKVKALEEKHPYLQTNTLELVQKATDAYGEERVKVSDESMLDFRTVLKATRALSQEIVLNKLMTTLMHTVLENAGAERGYLILAQDDQLFIEAEGSVHQNNGTTLKSTPVEPGETAAATPPLSTAIVNYVKRARENAVIGNAIQNDQFANDPYILQNMPKSIICVPLLHQGNLTGLLYLENNLTTNAFTPDRVEVLQILSAQAAISLENARLYQTMSRLNEELKEEIERKEVLLREIHHRVKNNLQVISSLLRLELGYAKDNETRQMFKESLNRIRSMALTHQKLYETQDLHHINFAEYIHSLTTHLFRSYGVDPNLIKLDILVDDVIMNIDVAIPCGLIVHELVSNALKHAFPKGRSGEIRVELRVETDGRLWLIVADNGIGLPEDLEMAETETLGLKLVKMLCQQIKGDVEVDRKNGTTFKISFVKELYRERI